MKNVLGHRDGHENLEFLGCIVLEPLHSMLALVGSSVKKCCKNRGFGRCSVSVRFCGRCVGNTWSVNFGQFFFFCKKKGLSKNFTGKKRFSLYFPVKSEMARNFQLHPLCGGR